MSSLFTSLADSTDAGCVRIGGRMESPENIGRAFLKGADRLADAWRLSGSRDDDLALPILHMYRHAIELLLKWACFEVRDCVTWGRRMGIGEPTVPADFAARLRTHSIANLVELYEEVSAGLSTSAASTRLPEETAVVFRQLHDYDTRGQSFRYGSQAVIEGKKVLGWAQVRPEPEEIHLDAAITRLHGAADMIVGGFANWIGAYSDYLGDMWTEYCANLDR